MSMGIFGKKVKADLDPDHYAKRRAYLKARKEEAVKIARERGRAAARAEANKKPFFKKLAGVGKAVVDDLGKSGAGIFKIPEDDPFGLNPSQKRKRKKENA